MTTDLATDLAPAFARLQADHPDGVVYVHPCELTLIQRHASAWLDDIRARLTNGTYQPSPAPPTVMPKPHWLDRPVVLLSFVDQLIYQHIGLLCLPEVAPLLRWSEKSIRFSHWFCETGRNWFRDSFTGWKTFDRASVEKANDGATHVLVADIAGYYENIDIGRLVQELRAHGVAPEPTTLLSTCLNKWAGARGKGIPQTYSPSHLYGEFFLNSVDRAISSEGISHLRYLDDLRVFCKSELDARRALLRLSELLRTRGLNLHSAKTEILPAREARSRFSHVHFALRRVSVAIAREIDDISPYATPNQLARYLQDADPDNPFPEVVGRAWLAFVSGQFGDFDKTLFHYLLARLADSSSTAALGYTIQTLTARPEETHWCLRYLGKIKSTLGANEQEQVAAVLTGSDTIYEYQRYLILRWFYEQELPHARVLAYCRQNVGVRSPVPLLRPYAARYLGRYADGLHDYETIIRAFQEETSPNMRAAYLVALGHAPSEVSGNIFGRARGEAPLVDWAIEYARTLSANRPAG